MKTQAKFLAGVFAASLVLPSALFAGSPAPVPADPEVVVEKEMNALWLVAPVLLLAAVGNSSSTTPATTTTTTTTTTTN